MSSSALDALRAYSARAPAAAGADAEADVQRHLQQIWDGRRAREAENEPSLAQIPRFFMPKQPAPAPAPAVDSEDAARQARACMKKTGRMITGSILPSRISVRKSGMRSARPPAIP